MKVPGLRSELLSALLFVIAAATIAYYLVPDWVNSAVLAIGGVIVAVSVVYRIRHNVWRAIKDGLIRQEDQLAVGIAIVFGFLAVQVTASGIWRFYNQASWWPASLPNFYIRVFTLAGAILYLYATRSDSGPPLSLWIRVTVAIVVAVVVIGLGVGLAIAG